MVEYDDYVNYKFPLAKEIENYSGNNWKDWVDFTKCGSETRIRVETRIKFQNTLYNILDEIGRAVTYKKSNSVYYSFFNNSLGKCIREKVISYLTDKGFKIQVTNTTDKRTYIKITW